MQRWSMRLAEGVRYALRCVRFVLKLALVTVAVMIPPLTTFFVAREVLQVTLWRSFGLAIAIDFALVAFVLICLVLSRIVQRLARWLWAFRFFRWIIWFKCAVGAAALARWNLRVSGEAAWIALTCESIGVALFALSLWLGRRFSKRQPAYHQPNEFDPFRIIVWLCALAILDWWLYVTVGNLFWRNQLTIPVDWLEWLRIPISVLPPLVFTVCALFARPPYLRRAAPRWRLRIWRGRGTPDLGVKIFLRFPLLDLNVGHQLKVLSFDVPASEPRGEPRPAKRVAAGESFVLRRMLWTGLALGTIASVAALPIAVDAYVGEKASDLSAIEDYQPAVSTLVYDRNDRLMCVLARENRVYVPISDIPLRVQQAFVAAEDKNFWQHDGIDPAGMIRAFAANMASGKKIQGASTITQQVIKLIVLKDSTKSYGRKLLEVVLAPRIEKQLARKYDRRRAKEKILEVYLTHVFLGKNAYGVEAASQAYFGKHVQNLTLAEAAMIAGLPKAPSDDSPDWHLERARVRQRYVLRRMLELGYITEDERSQALVADDTTIRRAHAFSIAVAPYACEEVRKFVEEEVGEEKVYEQGVVVKTPFDLELQEKAQATVHYGLLDLERRLGFEGPEGHDEDAGDRCDGQPGYVAENAIESNARVIVRERSSITLCVRGNRFPLDADDVRRVAQWEGAKSHRALKVGDLLTVRVETRTGEQGMTERVALTAQRVAASKDPKMPSKALQAGLVAIDQNTGEVIALVGGYDWNESQYNTATQAHRQTGSSFKMYVYLAALMAGKTVVSTVLDAPICLPSASGMKCYRNYDGPRVSRVFYGNVDLALALAKSLNSVSLRLAVEVGLDNIIATARSLGVVSKIVRVFPMALGTPELTLLEQTAAYAQIFSNGRALAVQHESGAPGVFVREILEPVRGVDGRMELHSLYKAPPRPERQAVPSGDAYAMRYLMCRVVESGTGTRARKLQRPVCGKTGTTNNFFDVWFMGGTADLTVGVWVGRMTPSTIAKEATGGGVALPIWEAFMESIFPVPPEGEAFQTPPRDFPIPDEVTLVYRGLNDRGQPVLLPFQRDKMPDIYRTEPMIDFGHDDSE